MEHHQKALNDFLVITFNEILRYEEAALKRWTDANLSISEIHVIEAVCNCVEEANNTASHIAHLLHITLGSLTVAVNTLETKGYLVRERSQTDKRVIYIRPTLRAELINQAHQDFHQEMIEGILDGLRDEEERILSSSLLKVRNFFLQKFEANEII